MRKNKLLILGLILLGIMILVTSYFLLKDSILMQRITYMSQGKENAINYIEEKYGFKAKITHTYCHEFNGSPIPFSLPSLTGDVYVDMRYDGKDFRVFISGDKKTTEGYDNYQVDIIDEAIKRKITDVVGEVISINLSYGYHGEVAGDKDYGLVSVYYDGENLDEVLEASYNNHAVISVVNANLDAIKDDLLRDCFGKNLEYAIVNYRSQDDYKKVDNLKSTNIDIGLDQYALYIEDYKIIKKSEEFYTNYVLGQYDNFYYCFSEGTYCNFEKSNEVDLFQWSEDGYISEKMIYDIYSIDTDAEQVILYVPYNDLGIKNDDGVSITTLYTYECKKTYNTEVTKSIENDKYIEANFYTFSKTDMMFTVINHYLQKDSIEVQSIDN